MLGLYNHNLIIFLKCCSAQNPFMWIKESSYSFSCDFWLGLIEVSAKNKNTFIIFSLFSSNTCELYYYFFIVLLSADREPGVYASVGLIVHGFRSSLLKDAPEHECGLQIVPGHMWMPGSFISSLSTQRHKAGTQPHFIAPPLCHVNSMTDKIWIFWVCAKCLNFSDCFCDKVRSTTCHLPTYPSFSSSEVVSVGKARRKGCYFCVD